MSDANDRTNPWDNEQAPFTSAAAEATTEAASEAAARTPDRATAPPPPAPAEPWGAPPAPGPEAYAAGASGTGAYSGSQAGGWAPAGTSFPMPPPAVPAGDPNPVAAFCLGLIPGVGAMYNGQVAKGFVHLIVFMVLVSIANHVNVFGMAVAGWIFFMAFEAYHTAKARRDGLPLPDPFGWNDIGEKVGLGKGWPFHTGAHSTAGAAAAGGNSTAAPAGGGNWTPVSPVPPVTQAGPAAYRPVQPSAAAGVAPNWAGYVPPSAFASAPGTNPLGQAAGGSVVPPGHGIPYVPVDAGATYSPPPPVDFSASGSRLPVGALWLIGLGVLFLLGQWTPLMHLGHVWIPSLLLAGLAALLFARRMGWTGSGGWQQPALGVPMGLRAASAIRVPGALLAVAVLNGLHEAWVVRWERSWPWLLIVIGLLMLVERVATRQAAAFLAADDPAFHPVQKGGL